MASPQVLTFGVGELEYAFDVADVVEIAGARPLTRVPGAPEGFAGVTSWRGRTIPVLDLGGLLKGDAPDPEDKSRLIILGRPEAFALRLDRPGRILRRHRTVETPDDVTAGGVSLIEGESGLVRLLDPGWLLKRSREAHQESA